MEKPLSKPISQKQFCFFGGVALVLLSLVLIINMWYVARALTFVFTYLLGLASYLLFAILFGIGVYLIVKRQPLKFRLSLKFFGVVLILVSLPLLFTVLKILLSIISEPPECDCFYVLDNFINSFKGEHESVLFFIFVKQIVNILRNAIVNCFVG